MLDIFASAVLESLISVAATSALEKKRRTTALRRSTHNVTTEIEPQRLGLAHDLQQAGVSAADTRAVWIFLGRPEGAMLCHYATIFALSTFSELESVDRELLESQAAALIRLAGQHDEATAELVAGPLCQRLIYAARETHNLIRRSDSHFASSVRDRALQQRQELRSVPSAGMRKRTAALNELAKTLPEDLVEQASQHAQSLVNTLTYLVVPTMRSDPVRVKHKELYVPRTITFEGSGQSGVRNGLLGIMNSHQHVVLLGDPGGGKSTEVRNAVLRFAQETIEGALDQTPFRLELRHYGREIENSGKRNTTIVDWLAKSASADLSSEIDSATVRYLLHTGRCVMFFDGLDEILNLETREEVVRRIDTFSYNFPLVSCVVTSRSIGYGATPLHDRFEICRLESLSTQELTAYCTNFLQASDDVDSEFSTEDFLLQTQSVDDIRRNPLMLGVLYSLYLAGRRIPRNRVELYSDCSSMLFSAWDSQRRLFVELEDELNAEAAVMDLALQVFRSESEEFEREWTRRTRAASYQRLSRWGALAAQKFADEALTVWRGRRWVIIDAGSRDGQDFLRFSHRTFLEYFAARQLVFESSNPKSLYKNLEQYILSRSATVLCALAVEMICGQQSTAAARILKESVKSANRALAAGTRLKAFNTLSFMIDTLPVMRVQSDAARTARNTVVREAVKLLALVSTPVNLPPGGVRPPYWHESVDVRHWNVWDEELGRSAQTFLLRGGDDSDTEDDPTEHEGGQTLSAACDILFRLEYLGEEERREMAEEIRAALKALTFDHAGPAYRLIYYLFFATWGSVWAGNKFCKQLRDSLGGLISDPALDGQALETTEPDFWISVRAVACGGGLPASWLERLSPGDLTVDVFDGCNDRRRISLFYIALVDLLDIRMAHDREWAQVHPERAAEQLRTVAARIVRSGPFRHLDWTPGWPAREIRTWPSGSKQDSVFLAELLQHLLLGQEIEPLLAWIENCAGEPQRQLSDLFEFFRYPVIDDPWGDLSDILPGLVLDHDDAGAVLERIGLI